MTRGAIVEEHVLEVGAWCHVVVKWKSVSGVGIVVGETEACLADSLYLTAPVGGINLS